jgi:hypothetical protein
MAGTIKTDVIQSELTTSTVFRNTSGTEIGRLVRSILNYNPSTPAINSSLNISSVTKNTTGDYTISFSIAFNDSFYSGMSSVAYQSSTTRGGNYAMIYWNGSTGTAPTSSAFRAYTGYGAASGANGGAGDYNPLHWTFTK